MDASSEVTETTAAAVAEFVPHRVVWTRAKSARFWDHAADRFGRTGTYFSQLASGTILRLVRRSGTALSGRVLDFGCGPGFLMQKLIENGIAVEGVDFSRDSIEAAKNR